MAQVWKYTLGLIKSEKLLPITTLKGNIVFTLNFTFFPLPPYCSSQLARTFEDLYALCSGANSFKAAHKRSPIPFHPQTISNIKTTTTTLFYSGGDGESCIYGNKTPYKSLYIGLPIQNALQPLLGKGKNLENLGKMESGWSALGWLNPTDISEQSKGGLHDRKGSTPT